LYYFPLSLVHSFIITLFNKTKFVSTKKKKKKFRKKLPLSKCPLSSVFVNRKSFVTLSWQMVVANDGKRVLS